MKDYSIHWFDIVISTAWIIFAIGIALIIYLKNKEKQGYKYFFSHFIWKTAVAIFFAVIYTTVYGGDTTAYFEGAITLKKLALNNPSAFFHELFSKPNIISTPHYFNHITGRPPIWIYREANSWFVSKTTCLFTFFSFNSFLCTNLLVSFISTSIVWRFFRYLIENTTIQIKYLAISILFMPTVGFWCSGIMKDTIVFSALLILIQGIMTIIFTKKINFINLLSCLISTYFIVSTRSFILIAVFCAIALYLVFKIQRHSPFITRFFIRTFGIIAIFSSLTIFIGNSDFMGEYSVDNILKTAQVTYNDFQFNQAYLGKRYDLGITEFTAGNMTRALPLAIITAIYRPFIWEAEGFLMYLNGLESLLMLYFTFKIFKKANREKINQIEENKLEIQTKDLVFMAVILVLVISFFVGFTSALFGVLVRMKAPIIPFVLLIIFKNIKEGNEKHLT